LKEEAKLLYYPDKILYVTPITVTNQKKYYPENANKMDWCPLPAYYEREYPKTNNPKKIYGYFGQYFPKVRNLEPFYRAAKEKEILVNIFGDPADLFESTKNIHIQPRVGLNELEEVENITDVLVFVANLKGGQIPGKIYQYSATNKTILFILDGAAEEQKILIDYFKKFKRYVFCENNVQSIKAAIERIESDNIEEVENISIQVFHPANIARSIIEKCKS